LKGIDKSTSSAANSQDLTVPGEQQAIEYKETELDRQITSTDKAPAAVGPYSQAVSANGFVFAAGQVGLDPDTGKLVGEDVASQTRQALQNIKAVLEASSSCLDHVVKTTVYLADIGDYGAMNEVYAEFFAEEPPARAAFQVAALPLGARVEIAAIAQVCDCDGEEGE
jgi:2-iminobutanoate/2-iminopropanoate deaminase